MARLLHSKGYRDVRPLLGGFDAWVEHGYPLERHGQGATIAILPATGPAQ